MVRTYIHGLYLARYLPGWRRGPVSRTFPHPIAPVMQRQQPARPTCGHLQCHIL
ncbi:hypothetical protein BDW72DRAFT_100996 [Aspergillus terricola var. indicus]